MQKIFQSHYLNISEMARLRGVTTETLRHYDRINLLKPDYLDKNRVRYYSVLKYEKLGTIRELEQIGLTLKEIKNYLADRNIKNSYNLLQQQENFYINRIKQDQAILKKISQKRKFIDTLTEGKITPGQIFIKHIDKRIYFKTKEKINDEIGLAYQCMSIEHKLIKEGEIIPIYASNRYAGIFSINNSSSTDTELIVFLDSSNNTKLKTRTIPSGRYLCLLSNNSFWDRKDALHKLIKYSKNHKLKLEDTVYLISQIDYSITNSPNERMVEYQIKIK